MLLVLGLAGLLSMPSVVFGEATWYGSFRGGLESAGDSTHMFSNGSRWGVKGSNEVSEGLSANYRYEEALDLATASLSTGNRLSYVGLSGGFGTISIGRIWSASWNSVGAILDNSYVYGTSKTSYRVGPAVSYSNSVGAASVQLDLVMDKANSEKSGVDQYEFGLSMDLGAATLAFAHRKRYVAADTEEKFMVGKPSTAPSIVVDQEGTSGTPPSLVKTDGTGTANTPTVVTVTPAEDGTPAVNARVVSNRAWQVANPNEAVPLVDSDGTAIAADDCTEANQVLVAADTDYDVTNGLNVGAAGATAAGCYSTAHGVTRMRSPLQSVRAGTDPDSESVNPIDDTQTGQENVHRSQGDCLANANDNVWEPSSMKCYPAAATNIVYLAQEATDGTPAVPETDMMVVVTTEGEAGVPTEYTLDPGTAAVPTTYRVEKGTDGEPSKFVTVTKKPAFDETLNAVAVKIAAGSHSAAVGLVKTSNSLDEESSTTIANAGGPLSDGLSYHFQIRDEEGSNNPWLIGLAKSLGGGSTLVFEHAKDAKEENHTALYLQVDF